MGIDRPVPLALALAIVILSPLIVFGLTVVYLAGWWGEALWRWMRGTDA